ncbi:hypothetical protein [Nonlabens sp.]|uniref:hypothetical protein n=1 Tax=Nonlabens sp. TaxID=1888209 RepID=UPI0025E76AB6|nr:hypothetical protein [Nonlabens sp.]
MKKTFYLVALFILSNTLLFTSCSNDDANSTDISQQIAAIESNATSGDWVVTNFNDSGVDETSDFSGYVFRFDTNGTLTATSTANTITGNWSVTDDSNSTDDDSSSDSDDIDFNIFFSVPDSSNFADLNDDWNVVSATTTILELIDISGGDGSTDRLILEKN